jgi:N-acetylglucosamine kinase-like BadF-type ATPase
MTIVTGVDVGGTKTTALVGSAESVSGQAAGPGAAIRPGRALASVGPIAECIRQALARAGVLRAEALVIGAAGAGHPSERGELAQAMRSEDLAGRVRVTTDLEIALVAAFGDQRGIVLSAGTGSAAVGRDSTSTIHRSGGYGWQMGDEGSGYALGRAALGAVGRARDGRAPATALTEGLLEATRCRDLGALVRWASTATPGAVASLAHTVLEAAAGEDEVATAIVDQASQDLARLAEGMLSHFGADEPVPLVLHGGVLRPGQPLHDATLAALSTTDRFRVEERTIDPAKGALVLAEALLEE